MAYELVEVPEPPENWDDVQYGELGAAVWHILEGREPGWFHMSWQNYKDTKDTGRRRKVEEEFGIDLWGQPDNGWMKIYILN